MLAQGGGGGGGWFNPAFIKVGIYVIFGLFVLLGGVFKKINEKNAQRAAEKARERRRDEMLRTGRDESGAFVDVSRVPAEALPAPVAAPSSDNEAKRRLQELAERRRRELAGMMKRAAQAGSVSGGGASRAGTTTPPRAVQRMPQSEQLQSGGRRNAEPDRKQQQQKKGKKGKQQQAREPEAPISYAMPAPPAGHTSAPVHSAYHLPQHRADAAETAPGLTGKEQISATMLRIGGTTAAAEWRRAIVLSELMQPPVSMRE